MTGSRGSALARAGQMRTGPGPAGLVPIGRAPVAPMPTGPGPAGAMLIRLRRAGQMLAGLAVTGGGSRWPT